MEIFSSLLGILALIALLVGSIGALLCFIVVIVQMFRRDQQTLGFVCIFLTIMGGMGTIIAFVVGWMRANDWQIKKTMLVWTFCIVLQFIGFIFLLSALVGFIRGTMQDELYKSRMRPPANRRIEVSNRAEIYRPQFTLAMVERHGCASK